MLLEFEKCQQSQGREGWGRDPCIVAAFESSEPLRQKEKEPDLPSIAILAQAAEESRCSDFCPCFAISVFI